MGGAAKHALRPWCHNRAPWADLRHPGDADRGIPPSAWPARWVLMGCGSYADVQNVGNGPQPLPVREGWDCDGCRWRPFVEINLSGAKSEKNCG